MTNRTPTKSASKKTQPQQRTVYRPAGEQDVTVDSAPSFGKRTIIKSIINCDGISSFSYIKEVSEKGGGFSMWKGADNTYNLAIDKVFIRRGGFIKTAKDVDPATDSDYVYISENQIVVSRPSTAGGAAGAFFGLDTPSNGLYGESSDAGGTGYGVKGTAAGSGNGVEGQSVSGYGGVFSGGVQISLGTLYIKERSAASSDLGTYGQLWVKDANPCELWFTDNAGADTKLA